MTKRTIFLGALLAWMTMVAVIGAASMPKSVLPYALAHAPVFVFQIFDLWLLCPALILFVLAIGPVPEHGRFGAVFRWFRQGRPVPPDREKWLTRVVTVMGLFMAFGQTWQTLALVLLWHKRQWPWVAQAMHGPHWAGLPDPHHLIPRLSIGATGLIVVWFGNGLPKLLSPFRGGREPYDWSKMIRACGWSMTLGGLAATACSVLVPEPRTAFIAGAAILVASCVATLPIWAIYRLGGGRGVAPPEGF